jgi:hypothetical protein
MTKEALGRGLSAIIGNPKHLKPTEAENDLEVATSKVDVTTGVSEVPSSNLKVVSRKSEVATPQSQAPRAQVEVPTSKSEVAGDNHEVWSGNLEVPSSKVKVLTSNLDIASSDLDTLANAVKDAQKSGRITVWSPLAAAVLKYKLNTTPRFSMSDELRAIVEEGLERKYPELCKKVREQMRKRSDHGDGRV